MIDRLDPQARAMTQFYPTPHRATLSPLSGETIPRRVTSRTEPLNLPSTRPSDTLPHWERGMG